MRSQVGARVCRSSHDEHSAWRVDCELTLQLAVPEELRTPEEVRYEEQVTCDLRGPLACTECGARY